MAAISCMRVMSDGWMRHDCSSVLPNPIFRSSLMITRRPFTTAMERLGSREAWAALAGVAAVRRTSPTRLTCLSLSLGNPWEAGSEAVLAASVAGPFPGKMSGEFQYAKGA